MLSSRCRYKCTYQGRISKLSCKQHNSWRKRCPPQNMGATISADRQKRHKSCHLCATIGGSRRTHWQCIVGAGAVLDDIAQLVLNSWHVCSGERQELKVHVCLVGGSSGQQPAGMTAQSLWSHQVHPACMIRISRSIIEYSSTPWKCYMLRSTLLVLQAGVAKTPGLAARNEAYM